MFTYPARIIDCILSMQVSFDFFQEPIWEKNEYTADNKIATNYCTSVQLIDIYNVALFGAIVDREDYDNCYNQSENYVFPVFIMLL